MTFSSVHQRLVQPGQQQTEAEVQRDRKCNDQLGLGGDNFQTDHRQYGRRSSEHVDSEETSDARAI